MWGEAIKGEEVRRVQAKVQEGEEKGGGRAKKLKVLVWWVAGRRWWGETGESGARKTWERRRERARRANDSAAIVSIRGLGWCYCDGGEE
jgi:hypothetical protein